VDQYFYGAHNEIQRATVQNVLNSMVKELAWNPDRKVSNVCVTATASARHPKAHPRAASRRAC
jgi:hypothetical protein